MAQICPTWETQDYVPGSQFWPGPTLAAASIWKAIKEVCVSLIHALSFISEKEQFAIQIRVPEFESWLWFLLLALC